MQQQAIPFALNPKSFLLTSFSLIIMVYAARSIARLALSRWLLLRRGVTLWFKRKLTENVDENDFQLRIIGDEERNVLGTRALRGASVA
jgi:hypothetical protein